MKYEPCVGCGYCCSKALCVVAASRYGQIAAPCPALRWHDDRYWCGIVEDAEGQLRSDIMKELAMGAGCPSTMFNTRREMMKALKGKGVLSGEESKET